MSVAEQRGERGKKGNLNCFWAGDEATSFLPFGLLISLKKKQLSVSKFHFSPLSVSSYTSRSLMKLSTEAQQMYTKAPVTSHSRPRKSKDKTK